MNELLVFGLGYSASAIAHLMIGHGWPVTGTARTSAAAESLRKRGFKAVLFDDADSVRQVLAHATHVLASAPPEKGGDPALDRYKDALNRASHLVWAGYLSTVGVYGDRGGGFVDEASAVAPASQRAVARVKAERDWQMLCHARDLPLDIFRLAGIYGPGRSPVDRILEGRAVSIVKPGQVFNRIHVDDIAATVEAAVLSPGKAVVRVFNVSDDEPAPPQDVLKYAAKLLGVAPPAEVAFEDAQLSEMARSFYSENKRVGNSRIKRELGVALKYPTYREGLAALAGASKRVHDRDCPSS